eukprot:gene20852-9846_t
MDLRAVVLTVAAFALESARPLNAQTLCNIGSFTGLDGYDLNDCGLLTDNAVDGMNPSSCLISCESGYHSANNIDGVQANCFGDSEAFGPTDPNAPDIECLAFACNATALAGIENIDLSDCTETQSSSTGVNICNVACSDGYTRTDGLGTVTPYLADPDAFELAAGTCELEPNIGENPIECEGLPPCAENFFVDASITCVACGGNEVNAAGDLPENGQTACEANPCDAVTAGACVACSGNEVNAAGDLPSDGTSTCDANPCDAVTAGACVACGGNEVNAAGDLPSDGTSTCDANPCDVTPCQNSGACS